MKKLSLLKFACLSLGLTASTSFAVTSTFNVAGLYLTAGSWTNGVPDLNGVGNIAYIDAAANYVPGGDFPIHNGSTLQIDAGGSWTQSGGNAWIQLAGGSIVVNGGSFDMGTAGNINGRNSTSAITINSGSLTLAGNFNYDPTNLGAFNVNGGTTQIAGEFDMSAPFSLGGGTLQTRLFVFQGGSGVLNINSGTLSTDGSATDGGGGATNGLYGISLTQYVNFSNYGTAIYFRNFSTDQLTTAGWLTNGALKFQGAVNPTAFSVVSQGGGVLVTAVPEPSSYAAAIGLACLGLVIMRRRQMSQI